MVSLVNSDANATRIGWHLWEIDLIFAPGLPPGWLREATAPPVLPGTLSGKGEDAHLLRSPRGEAIFSDSGCCDVRRSGNVGAHGRETPWGGTVQPVSQPLLYGVHAVTARESEREKESARERETH